MPSPIDSPSYDHLTIEENADTTRTSSGMSGAVATPPSTTGEWLRAARIARALLKRWVTPFFALQIICILIVISITPMADSYVYAGSLQFIAWGITVGFALSLTERSLLFAGATAQTIWRITIACACATTALIAIGMAICTALDIAVGNVKRHLYLHRTVHWSRTLPLAPRPPGGVPRIPRIRMCGHGDQALGPMEHNVHHGFNNYAHEPHRLSRHFS